MTFSVRSGEFGMSERFFHDTTAISSPACGTKARVCVVYYDSAQCPYSNNCEHAHHFTELDRETQEKLLETVSLDGIPRHFIETSCLFAHAAASHNVSGVSRGGAKRKLNASVSGAASPFSGRRGAGGAREAAAPYDKSFSSLASSSESLLPGAGSAFGSACGSPVKGPRREEEPFRIRLPARCRYPHRATAGTYYDVLGIVRGAPQDEIIERYRQWQREGYKRAKQADQQRADAIDTIVVEARNVLGHPALRAEYDRTLPSMWGA